MLTSRDSRATPNAQQPQAEPAVTPVVQSTAPIDPFADLPFAGRPTVRYEEFVGELRDIASELAGNANVQAAHTQLLNEHALTDAQVPLESFSRTRLVFESARDGGLWDLRWAITDQMPWSDRIWQQWTARASELEAALPKLEGEAGPSAEAECDELSALFALLVRDLSVNGKVALHWPYWNHVVAVWEVPRDKRHVARIVVPTSQVFLSPEAGLGTRQLPTERVLFAYARRDLKFDAEIPGALARFLLGRSRALGGLSSEVLSARRARLGGS
jgi:hypothetical protein